VSRIYDLGREFSCLHLTNFPVQVNKLGAGISDLPPRIAAGNDRCFRGIRVLELNRVVTAPVAGKILAAHRVDILWITSPSHPDLPELGRDLARGKRTAQLDLLTQEGREKSMELAKDADVFIQGYRPGSLAAKDFSPSGFARINPSIVYANVSAYGPSGPWSRNRGFDSMG